MNSQTQPAKELQIITSGAEFHPGTHDLYVVAEPGNITFLVANTKKEVVLLGTSGGEADDSDFGTRLFKALKESLTEANLIRPWRSVYLCWSSMEATLVPDRLFDPDHAPAYLSKLCELHTDAEIRTDVWEKPSARLVYSIWADLLYGVQTLFQDVVILHHHTVLNKWWLRDLTAQANIGQQDQRLYLHILTKRIVLAYYTDGQLMLINQYAVENEIDCLYYTLLIYNQFRLDEKTIPLMVSGRIKPNSPAMMQLLRFIRHVHLFAGSTRANTAALSSQPDSVVFADLLVFPTVFP